MNETVESLKFALEAGALGVLVLVLLGLYLLAKSFLPQIILAWNNQAEKFTVLSTKIDAMGEDIDQMRTRSSEAATGMAVAAAEIRGGAFATGQHQAVQVERAERLPPSEPSRRRDR